MPSTSATLASFCWLVFGTTKASLHSWHLRHLFSGIAEYPISHFEELLAKSMEWLSSFNE
jgi:hypothetical protein